MNNKRFVSQRATSDIEQYRAGYPKLADNKSMTRNLRFYQNQLPSKPKGALIDEILSTWKGKYDLLEEHHGYIQWLFPIREPGLNSYAQPLQLHEARAISADSDARTRVIAAYELMLDFYGLVLVNRETGEVARASNYQERYKNLNNHPHNNLRITRILKSLGELGFEHMKVHLVRHILSEIYEHRLLNERVERSCTCYWVETLKSEQQRNEMQEYIAKAAQPSTSSGTASSSTTDKAKANKTPKL